ncbi:unnamed protein product [Rangifer tarandus platyrhynchus]|uniref:Uncharacterized protein n=1 Tax=Rangifer tarandus platyrhynchus TaxID=3082113 RepID=A0AC59ZTJ3_RANTA
MTNNLALSKQDSDISKCLFQQSHGATLLLTLCHLHGGLLSSDSRRTGRMEGAYLSEVGREGSCWLHPLPQGSSLLTVSPGLLDPRQAVSASLKPGTPGNLA